MADTVQRQLTEKGQVKLAVVDPEYTISVIGLVASFCGQPIVGLILTIIALKHSKRDGRYNIYALVGLIISIVQLAIWALFIIAYIAFFGLIFITAATHGMRA